MPDFNVFLKYNYDIFKSAECEEFETILSFFGQQYNIFLNVVNWSRQYYPLPEARINVRAVG